MQAVSGSGSRRPHLAADIGQLRAGRIGDLVLAADGIRYLLLQELVGMEGVEQVVDGGLSHAVLGDIAPHQAGALEHPGDVQQLPGIQGPAQIGPGQGGTHVLHPGKTGAASDHHHGLGGAGLLLAMAHGGGVGGRRQLPGLLLGGVSHGLRRQHLQHGGQLQGH